MPSTWDIAFDIPEPRLVRPSGVHAFLARVLAEESDAHRNRKPYCLTGVSIKYGLAVVGVSFINDGAAAIFSDVTAGEDVWFGKSDDGAGTVAAPPRLTREATWEELAEIGPREGWGIELRSPMCFRRGKLSQPWPSPERILNSLADNWELGTGEEFPLEFPEVSALAITDVRLETVRTPLTPTPTAGAVGSLEWRWAPNAKYAPDTEGAAAVSALLGLAEFSGVGAYTQFGLGQVRVTSLEPHPRSNSRASNTRANQHRKSSPARATANTRG